MRVLEYNRTEAVEYARKWALGRNPAYYDFEEIGGDCTGFASQCVYAGAKVMNFMPVYGWYYISPSDRTASWTGVRYFYDFIVNNRGAGPFAREVLRSEAEPGDIIQLGRYSGEYYHTLIVTEIKPVILVAAHSYDALDRSLDSYEYDKVRFLHIYGVRV